MYSFPTSLPATEEILTIWPLPRSRICGPKVATKHLNTAVLLPWHVSLLTFLSACLKCCQDTSRLSHLLQALFGYCRVHSWLSKKCPSKSIIKSLAKRDIYKRQEFLCLIFKCSALTSCKVSAVTTYSSHCCYTNSQDACLADQIVLWAIHVKESLTPRLPGIWYHYSSTLYYVYTVPPQTSLHCLSLFGVYSVIHGQGFPLVSLKGCSCLCSWVVMPLGSQSLASMEALDCFDKFNTSNIWFNSGSGRY